MALHDDVVGRILTILKQDDYYRTLEELPTIDSFRTYDDIKLFPNCTILSPSLRESPVKLTSSKDSYDDWVCTLCLKLPIPSTSGFIPRPMSTFKPVAPANSQHTADAQNTYQQQSIGSSPGSSLPCTLGPA